MSIKSISRKRHLVGFLSLFLIAVPVLVWRTFEVHSSGQSSAEAVFIQNSLDGTDVVRQLPLMVNDIVYNAIDGSLYASRPSSSGSDGNSISKINPLSAAAVSTVYVGSEPGKIALTDDGQALFVILNGAYAVRRFDIAAQTAGPQFSIGSDSNSIYTASDIAVVPGYTNRVAVARYSNQVSPPGAGVAIFENGFRLQQTGPGHSDGANYLAFSATSATLYGGGLYGGLRTMSVSDAGVVDSGTTTTFGVRNLKFDGGRLYTSTGQVIDPPTRTLLGTFPNATSSAFVSDSAVGRAYFAMRESNTTTVTIKAYDAQTYVLIGSLTIPNITTDPTTLVRYGTNGLAMATTDNKLFLIQTSLIPTNNPLPTPTATPASTPTPTPTVYSTFTRHIVLANNDLVLNRATQKMLVTVPSREGARGNSITQFDPQTGELENSVFVGSEPGKLVLAGDNQTAWVGLNGAGSVRKYDVLTQTPGLQFSLGLGGNGPGIPYDLDVMPDSPNTIAVSDNYSGTIGIYDSGVRRAQTGNSSGYIAFRSATELLTGSDPIFRYAVNSNGLAYLSNFQTGATGEPKLVNGRFYFPGGRVMDANTQTVVGTFTGLGYYTALEIDQETNRAYFLTNPNSGGYAVRVYDLSTFLPLGSIPITEYFQNTPPTFFRWGTNGLAYRDGAKIVLLQSTLVNPAGPVPTPTPTVSPTPTPTPLNAPTFFRTVNLPAKDVVYSSTSQALFVSVPGVAGVGLGNTISKINPLTGNIDSSVFIGSEPSRLALSDDGQTLYAKLDGANSAVRRFDIPTQTAGAQFAAPPYFIDMKVMPGSPQTLAFASGVGGGVSIFDNGVQRPDTTNGGAYGIYSIDFANPGTIYGYDNYSSGFELIRLSVGPSGVTGLNIGNNLISGYGVQIKYANGLLYASSGRVADPATQSLKGTFQSGGSAMAVDTGLGRVFFLDNNVLTAYDANTFLKIGSATLPLLSGMPTNLVRWGDNGLAFQTNASDAGANRLYILQSSLVSSTALLPTGVQMSASSYQTQEPVPSFSVAITRTGGTTGTSTVDYATADGTATSGLDYTAVSGTLTFLPGETTKAVSIPLLNDNIFEPNETFVMNLSNPVGDNIFLLSPSSATVTIAETDQRPRISGANTSVSEVVSGSTSVALIPVTLSNPSTETITVNFLTSNGTATAGADYVATSGTLTFGPLETSKVIPVTINGDNAAEPNETFTVNLSAPTNSTIQVGSATVTIVNFVPQAQLPIFDFDGDRKTDLSIFRPNAESGAEWWWSRSSDGGNAALQFGTSSDVLAPVDFTGDGKTDVAFWRPATGQWFVLRSEDFSFYAFPFGATGDVPVPADYDGDRKADAAVFRESSLTWFISKSSGGTDIVGFGAAGDKPVNADYDGDGKADIAIYRPNGANGSEWWIRRSSNLGVFATQFGQPSDKAVAGDYTGDGKADIAFWTPSSGNWFVLRSEDFSYYAFPFGASTDVPVPGDYDGDGKMDAAVFRPSTSTWFANRSTAGVLIQQFGIAGDVPVPNAFVR